ncbi:MAG: preprotein translocase subunit SecG [Niameybacter sp.]
MSVLEMVIAGVFVLAALAIIVIVLLQEGKSAGLGAAFATSQETWTKITAGVFVVLAVVLNII